MPDLRFEPTARIIPDPGEFPWTGAKPKTIRSDICLEGGHGGFLISGPFGIHFRPVFAGQRISTCLYGYDSTRDLAKPNVFMRPNGHPALASMSQPKVRNRRMADWAPKAINGFTRQTEHTPAIVLQRDAYRPRATRYALRFTRLCPLMICRSPRPVRRRIVLVCDTPERRRYRFSDIRRRALGLVAGRHGVCLQLSAWPGWGNKGLNVIKCENVLFLKPIMVHTVCLLINEIDHVSP